MPGVGPGPLGADFDTHSAAGAPPDLLVPDLHRFPDARLVGASVALFTPDNRPLSVEGLRYRLEVAPAAVRVSRRSFAGRPPSGDSRRGLIDGWSKKSRLRMMSALAALDYRPMFSPGFTPAMLTLTLPGDWLPVAPTGRAFKRLLDRWFRRWDRAWGLPLVWKLEFQLRGAPHVHLFAPVPTGSAVCRCRLCGKAGTPLRFKEWLSHSWADVVSHPDPEQYARNLRAGTGIDYREGLKATDPKRLAVYFGKHGGAAGGKEYQHRVPDEWQPVVDPVTGEVLAEGSTPGRFWGVRGLEPVWGGVDVAQGDALVIVRTMRRWSSRQAFYPPGDRWPSKVEPRTGTFTKRNGRKSRRRKSYVRGTAGFVLPNDGPAFASMLARAVERG